VLDDTSRWDEFRKMAHARSRGSVSLCRKCVKGATGQSAGIRTAGEITGLGRGARLTWRYSPEAMTWCPPSIIEAIHAQNAGPVGAAPSRFPRGAVRDGCAAIQQGRHSRPHLPRHQSPTAPRHLVPLGWKSYPDSADSTLLGSCRVPVQPSPHPFDS
jgi:hypothetical protein